MEDEDGPLGWVPLDGRGSLPFALVHGESLVAAASWAVGESGARLYDATVTFDEVRRSGQDLLLHDPLCPLTPADFLADAAARCRETGRVVVGYRPVTDTVKVREGDHLGAGVDRDTLRLVVSPVVLPADVVAGLDDLGSTDFADLVGRLAADHELEWLEAPALAGRITRVEELVVLEALSRASA
ncbi:2-C-methyl-D-erythritol 4-phosphate cytidylyltransferase [Marmoricola sp. RAF53]|uniref:2-C-methyl-D-erythritol 4-phosphate cytidylyltransferase n=1 Tax=Marmoricola sp. RAF53 TaxID=3233059 RepID=UPI003F9588A9